MSASKSIEKSPESLTGPTAGLHPSPPHEEANAFLALPRVVGNQAMLRLFASGIVQPKLRVSQPGDSDEQEADRVAAHLVSSRSLPTVQRKCACGGTCSQCQEEQDTLIHRSALEPLHPFPLALQRAASDEPTRRTATAQEGARHDAARHPGEHPQAVIVDDDTASLAPGQMRKAQFLTLLQTSACATADAVLESVGHSTKSCPYLKKWLEHYRDKDAQHLTRAMHKYAPETGRARSAHEAIALLNHRIERAALSWAKTGKVSGLPEDVQAELAGGGGFLGALAGFAASGFGSGLLGFLGGSKADSAAKNASEGKVQKKSRDGAASGVHDVAAVKGQLGSGQALDGRVQSRFSSAFGYDFSGVRVHTDSKAAELSSQLNARAFTIGSDVAFAGGEYQPGSLIGDALIAHELAHVVQQGGGNAAAGPHAKDATLAENSQLEQDADHSAVGAVLSAWTGAKKGLAEIGANALPRLKSGLKLQRCANCGTSRGKREEVVTGCLDDLYAGGCAFPGSSSWRYDSTYWEPASDPDYVAYKPKAGVTPSQAMDKLYERLSLWDFDCALYPEVARLCTYRRTLGAEEFDKRFANLKLRQHESPGVATEFHDIETEDPATFNQLWDDSPVGSKVMWTNKSPVTIGTAWHNENAIKRKKGDKPEDARYDAHPLGKNLTEKEVMRGLAENADDFPTNAAAQEAYIRDKIYRHQLHILK